VPVKPTTVVVGFTSVYTKPMTQTKILNVNIIDATGEIVADVDATDTADALAYYLTSRRILGAPSEEKAIAAQIRADVGPEYRPDTETTSEGRGPIFGELLWEYSAQVH
jgi:hypothetical protein